MNSAAAPLPCRHADFYDIDRANARLPELAETLLMLRGLRTEVIALRDRSWS